MASSAGVAAAGAAAPQPGTAARAGFHVAFAATLLFALLFAGFALDLGWHVWVRLSTFETRSDALLLVLLEVLRAATIIIAVAAASHLAWRRPRQRYRAMLGLGVTLFAIAYAQAFAFPALGGQLQGALARSLLDAGTSPALLAAIFGSPVWALWLALGAALRAAVLATAAAAAGAPAAGHGAVRGNGERQGLLRASRVAGVDVGGRFGAIARAALANGWLRARFVWPGVAIGAVAQLVASPALAALLVLVHAVAAGVALTLLRVAARGAPAALHNELGWFGCAAALAAFGFVLGGTLALAVPRAAMLSLVLLMATPLAVASCVVLAARGSRADAGRALGRSTRAAVLAFVAILLFAVADSVISAVLPPASRLAVPLAALCAVLGVIAARRPLARARSFVMRPAQTLGVAGETEAQRNSNTASR